MPEHQRLTRKPMVGSTRPGKVGVAGSVDGERRTEVEVTGPTIQGTHGRFLPHSEGGGGRRWLLSAPMGGGGGGASLCSDGARAVAVRWRWRFDLALGGRKEGEGEFNTPL